MAGLSPTQRTMKALKARGLTCAIAERWIPNPVHPGGGFRKDLFGFIDIIALDSANEKIIGIQSCGQSFAAHLRKIMDSDATPNVIEWLKCGGELELHAWQKVKKVRGGKVMVWRPRVKAVTLEDFK